MVQGDNGSDDFLVEAIDQLNMEGEVTPERYQNLNLRRAQVLSTMAIVKELRLLNEQLIAIGLAIEASDD